MDYSKPIYAEIYGTKDADNFREFLKDLGVKFTEFKESYYYIDDLTIFECRMTKEQMHLANIRTSALLYQ